MIYALEKLNSSTLTIFIGLEYKQSFKSCAEFLIGHSTMTLDLGLRLVYFNVSHQAFQN